MRKDWIVNLRMDRLDLKKRLGPRFDDHALDGLVLRLKWSRFHRLKEARASRVDVRAAEDKGGKRRGDRNQKNSKSKKSNRLEMRCNSSRDVLSEDSPATSLAWFPNRTLLATQNKVASNSKNQGRMIPSDSLCAAE